MERRQGETITGSVSKGEKGDRFLTRHAAKPKLLGCPGGRSNLYVWDGSKFDNFPNRIYFDNHYWVIVDGKVYDFVAGIKGGGQDVVDTAEPITGGRDQFTTNSYRITKASEYESENVDKSHAAKALQAPMPFGTAYILEAKD